MDAQKVLKALVGTLKPGFKNIGAYWLSSKDNEYSSHKLGEVNGLSLRKKDIEYEDIISMLVYFFYNKPKQQEQQAQELPVLQESDNDEKNNDEKEEKEHKQPENENNAENNQRIQANIDNDKNNSLVVLKYDKCDQFCKVHETGNYLKPNQKTFTSVNNCEFPYYEWGGIDDKQASKHTCKEQKNNEIKKQRNSSISMEQKKKDDWG